MITTTCLVFSFGTNLWTICGHLWNHDLGASSFHPGHAMIKCKTPKPRPQRRRAASHTPCIPGMVRGCLPRHLHHLKGIGPTLRIEETMTNSISFRLDSHSLMMPAFLPSIPWFPSPFSTLPAMVEVDTLDI